MIPHQKALVKRLKDEPFVLFGVNGDTTDAYQAKHAEMGITWTSVKDKSAGTTISQSWGVSAWPTIYVLDHEGVIRYKNVRGDDLDAAIEELVKKAEAAQK